MTQPEGTLSPAQYEILETLWEIGPPGGTTLQIWQIISRKRSIVRNTIVNLVDRLANRGWLRREAQLADGWHYWPTVSRDEAESTLADQFVKSFFRGKASKLLVSLVGQQKVSPDELAELKRMVEEAEAGKRGKTWRASGGVRSKKS